MTITIDEMASFCKRKGLVFPSVEIYGGMAGSWDYGPAGVELANNLKQSWWKYFVQDREDMVGVDGSIVNPRAVWEASGHTENFDDILVGCTQCKEKHRADHLVEDSAGIRTDGMTAKELDKHIKKNNIRCKKCGGELGQCTPFNLMFETYIGDKSPENQGFLRPETAQIIFTNFKGVADTSRVKTPFGIAQIGKVFRNEIAPRNFLFRCREFEQMEIEYFIHPKQEAECPFLDEVAKDKLVLYTQDDQKKDGEAQTMTAKEAVTKKVLMPWHSYWLATIIRWFVANGAKRENFRCRQHVKTELSHYAKDTWDVEYKFPFGYKELQGVANRQDFDLQQHIKHSGKELTLFDEESKEKFVPHVVCEPSQGVGRALLVFLFDAYEFDHKRENVVLHLHPKLAPYKAAIFPLLKNRKELVDKAKEVYEDLKKDYNVFYDESGSIGKRYARQDEIGTPLCITIDFDSLEGGDVTLRDRDTTKQERVKTSALKSKVEQCLRRGNK
ncbi:glycine--tRNA ligase [Candidatus Woesearchaeota archaeon]|nr:glycine--tRNA ligase [Candidatus Woesearchaeota archaeon]